MIIRVVPGVSVVPESISAVRLRRYPAEERPNTFRALPEDGTHTVPAEQILDVIPVMGGTWVEVHRWNDLGAAEHALAEIEAALSLVGGS